MKRTKSQRRVDDQAFREWVQRQPSCLSGRFSEYVNGEGRCIAAHVRRAATSGTAFKATYSCVPLTHEEHLIQHQHGEAACLNRFHGTDGWPSEAAKWWFDEKVREYRERWESLQESNNFHLSES